MNDQSDKFLIENDDYPVFQLVVEQVGEQRAKVFAILRQVIQLSPREAQQLLQTHRFEVIRGARMDIEPIQKKLEWAGAKTQLIVVQTE